MLPVSLTFNGLRSYTTETTVVFSDLEFFAVIGETGAGKSTIIEAISFALYGRQTWSGHNKTDLIADSASVMSVAFTFTVGTKTWTATRSRRRSSTPGVDKLECDDGTTPAVNGFDAVTKRVEEILGLNHEQFCRAVVMPQGAFDELLRAGTTERTKILRSILGLDEVAATGRLANEIASYLAPLRATYTERRARYPKDPAEALAEAHDALDGATAALERCTKALETIDGPAEERERIADATVPLRIAIDQVPAVKGAHDTLAECRTLGNALREELAAETEAEQEALAKRTGLQHDRETTLNGFPTPNALSSAAARVSDLAARIGSVLAALDAARSERAGLADAPPDTPDQAIAEAADAAAEAFAAAERAHTGATEAERLAREAHGELTGARDELDQAATALTEAEEKVDGANRCVEELGGEVDVAATRKDEAVAALEAAHGANLVAAVGIGHQPGDDCPVCDQTLPDTFAVHGQADLAAHDAAVTAGKAALAEATQAHSTARHDAAVAATNRDTARDRHQTCADAVTSTSKAVAAAGADPTVANVDEAVATLTAAAQVRAEELRTAASAKEVTDQAMQEALTQVAVAKAEHGGAVMAADERIASCTQVIAGHRRVLDGLPDAWRPNGDLDVHIGADLRDRLDAAVKALGRIDADVDDADEARNTAKGKIAAIKQRASDEVTGPGTTAVATVNDRLDRVRDVISAAVAVAGLVDANAPAADGLANVAADVKVDQLNATIAKVDRATCAAETALAAASVVLITAREAIRVHDETVTAAVGAAGYDTVDALRTSTGEARSDVRSAEEAVAKAASDKVAAQAAADVLAELAPFHDNVQVLGSTLTDSKFVGHLLKHRQAALLHEASQRLRDITNNKFGFTGDFSVLAVASGATRTPENLSGGQKFQASLALALALVEIATRGGGKLDSVFVDEGFGTLDVAALDTALSTLERVAGDGKVVGLISHLRPVAEHVSTVLHVTYDDVDGSRIDVLDPDERDQLLADDIRSGLHA